MPHGQLILTSGGLCEVTWVGIEPGPNRSHRCGLKKLHYGKHECKHCPATLTLKPLFWEKPVEVPKGPFTFPTPAQLDAVHNEEITRCAAFLAHIIQNRLSQETTGSRQIFMSIDTNTAPLDQRFHLSVMVDAIERLSNDLYASGWVADAQPNVGRKHLLLTLTPRASV